MAHKAYLLPQEQHKKTRFIAESLATTNRTNKMIYKDDINKAQEHIKGLIKLGEQIQESTQYLLKINENLDWYKDVFDSIPDKQNDILSIIESPILGLQNLNYSDFSLAVATGSTAMVLTSFEDTSTLINNSDEKYHYLLDKLDEINPVDKTIDEILSQLNKIEKSLFDEFSQVKNSYDQWRVKFRSNSDLAKDIRTFQEHFEGNLNKLRVPKCNWENVKIPRWSWNKMINEIGKPGAEYKRALLKQKSISENIWKILTPVLKKTKEVTDEEMRDLFKSYVEHLYSVISLIDDRIINQ